MIGFGYKITVKQNSSEAPSTFTDHPGGIDLAITDQTMPGMTGVEAAEKMPAMKKSACLIRAVVD